MLGCFNRMSRQAHPFGARPGTAPDQPERPDRRTEQGKDTDGLQLGRADRKESYFRQIPTYTLEWAIAFASCHEPFLYYLISRIEHVRTPKCILSTSVTAF